MAAQVGQPSWGRARETASQAVAFGQMGIESMGGPPQPAEILHHDAVPAGDVADQFFQQARRTLATSVIDGFRYVDTAATGIKRGDKPRGHKIADVGHGPVIA